MSSSNGRLLASELATVEGLPLGKGTANAYVRMKAAAKSAGIDIWIAQPIGGYRSYAVQADMKVHPALYGLSTVSTVTIASAGYSTHGLGNALDIGSFGSAYGTAGAKRSAWLIQHAPEFGFFREFGDKDPNHFHHDGFTAVAPIINAAETGGLIPIEEDDVALLKDEREALFHLRDAADQIRDYLGANGGSNTATEHTVGRRIDQIAAGLAALPGLIGGVDEAVWATQVGRMGEDGKVVGVNALQELADAKSNVLALLANGGIDTKKLAADLAAEITPASGATTADVEAAVTRALARVFVTAN